MTAALLQLLHMALALAAAQVEARRSARQPAFVPTLGLVYLEVLFNDWYGRFYNALEKKDEAACYQWAVQQTGFDPAKAQAPSAPPTTAMNRYSMPIFSPKGLGLTERWK